MHLFLVIIIIPYPGHKYFNAFIRKQRTKSWIQEILTVEWMMPCWKVPLLVGWSLSLISLPLPFPLSYSSVSSSYSFFSPSTALLPWLFRLGLSLSYSLSSSQILTSSCNLSRLHPPALLFSLSDFSSVSSCFSPFWILLRENNGGYSCYHKYLRNLTQPTRHKEKPFCAIHTFVSVLTTLCMLGLKVLELFYIYY